MISDAIDATDAGKRTVLVFYNARTVIGFSSVLPTVFSEGEYKCEGNNSETLIATENNEKFRLIIEQKQDKYYFTFTYLNSENEEESKKIYSEEEILNTLESRKSYYENKPECKDSRYERLYAKCLSVNKVNVYSPSGKITTRWTTPDRVPHRHMWLWDSVFHSLSIAEYNPELAKECLLAPLRLASSEGFISHAMNTRGRISNVTQPPIFAFGVWNAYEKTGDKAFIAECAPYIDRFLSWCMTNRDKNGNGLLEWWTDPRTPECRCGESGLDNSPRFDFDSDLDAVDFTTYLANDLNTMAKIYRELGDSERAGYYEEKYSLIRARMNELLWDEVDGLYYDRTFDGELTRVMTSASFLPLFAGIPDEERARRMLNTLLSEDKFYTKMPIPSISKDSPLYELDMWRGCTWLNINYLIMIGLKKYGFFEVLDELCDRTLSGVYKWYEKTGNIFEFYDADDEVNPFMLNRKGPALKIPDYRAHVHSITDYNWSASITMLLINKIIL